MGKNIFNRLKTEFSVLVHIRSIHKMDFYETHHDDPNWKNTGNVFIMFTYHVIINDI